MTSERLRILCVSQMPASPPRFGAQARMHGLMTQLARHHDLTAVTLVDDEFDAEECRQSMQAYCLEVVNLEFPYLGHYQLRQAPPGERVPVLVVDSHEIAYDLARQFARARGS